MEGSTSISVYGHILECVKKDLSNPEELVEELLQIGRDIDAAKPGETVRIIDGELELYNYHYATLKFVRARERGVRLEVIAGPVVQGKGFLVDTKTYLEWYKNEEGISEYEKLADSFYVAGELEPAMHALKKALEEQPDNERVASKISGLEKAIAAIQASEDNNL